MKILTYHEERMSTVKRWGIVRTIQTQNVMEHAAKVAIMAPRIAMEHFNEYDFRFLYHLTRIALMHDQFEVFTGDMPTPTSKYIDKKVLEEKFYEHAQEPYLGASDNIKFIKKIIKIADCLEAVIFLTIEIKMGNVSVRKIREDVCKSLAGACDDIELFSKLLREIELEFGQDQDPLND